MSSLTLDLLGRINGSPILGPFSRQDKPRRSGAPLRQHERAGRAGMDPGPRGRLYRQPARAEQPAATAILHRLARRTAPQPSPPRSGSRALGGARKPRRRTGSSGAIDRHSNGGGPFRTACEFQPFRPVAQADSDKKGPSAKPGPVSQDTQTVVVAAFHPGQEVWPFGRRPPSQDGIDGPRAGAWVAGACP